MFVKVNSNTNLIVKKLRIYINLITAKYLLYQHAVDMCVVCMYNCMHAVCCVFGACVYILMFMSAQGYLALGVNASIFFPPEGLSG